MLKLYDLNISGNSYKIRLMLSLLDVPYQKIPVDVKAKANKSAEFLKINPRGQLPALEDDGFVIWDSSAILVYLALKYGGGQWYPTQPEQAAEVARWVAISQQGEIASSGLSRARGIKLFGTGTAEDLAKHQATGRQFLKFFDSYLQERTWLALERPTIGDIACYPYIALAPDGGVALEEFKATRAWIERIGQLPGYIELPPPFPEIRSA